MSDDLESQGWMRLGVAAALAKQFEADQKHFLVLMARTLQEALPEEVSIRTKGIFSSKKVVGVSVDLGDRRYALDDPGHGSIVAVRVKIVRGIALKTEEIAVADCLEELSEELEKRASKTSEARKALASMLGLQ